jgi:hypothetical protein
MPGDPRECRERAARCLELAASTANEGIKQLFLSISKQWEALAAELERAKKIIDDDQGALKTALKKSRRTSVAKKARQKKSARAVHARRAKQANGHAGWCLR